VVRRMDHSKFTTYGSCATWISRGGGKSLCGLSGWQHADARLSSLAFRAMRRYIDPRGFRRGIAGKPEEIERLTSGLERGCPEKYRVSGNSLAPYVHSASRRDNLA
jgi:hypothetical protein